MSPLINIDQARAKNAISEISNDVKKEESEGDALSGFPSLIINNGLIACIAYSLEKEAQHLRVVEAIAFHLNDQKIIESSNALAMRGELCNADAATLQRATHETLEFLAYLKRFQRS